MKQIKRRLLISLLFDVETSDSAFDTANVSIYMNHENGTIETMVNSGWIHLPLHKQPPKIERLKELKGLQQIFENCKFAIEEILHGYKGDKKVSDYYLSPFFHDYMRINFGIININNDPIPTEY